MERTCSECGKSFAHASSYSRHRKVCGTASPQLSCPNCTSTFTRASNLSRHVKNSCKGAKRSAETILPENPKRSLVDYESSDEEPLSQPMAEVHTMGPWRSEEQPSDEEEPSRSWSSDTESEEEVANPIKHWRAPPQRSDEEESSDSEDEDAESLDSHEEFNEKESSDEWHTAEEEVPEEQREVLSLDSLREALPWAEYQGIPAEQFGGAMQRMEGNPLFEFTFTPISEQQWMRRVQKTVFHAQLHQLRDPLDTDDMGVAIIKALEEATRHHLTKIRAKDEDKVFLAITPNGFEHVYQTTQFKAGEFKEGSARLDALMRKIAGKLNSNESFNPEDGFQVDLTLLRPMGSGSGHGKRLNPGRMGVAMSRNVKKAIVEIKNSDELCCARAIITMKALAEYKVAEKKVQEENENSTLLQKLKEEEEELLTEYKTLRDTKLEKRKITLQRLLANRLHESAGVPKGPCGREELQTFQEYLADQDPPFQLKVFCDLVKKPLFTGQQKADDDHIICLLKVGSHYDGISSLPGFMNTSYYCHQCNKAFNTDDPAHHSCHGQKCRACGGHQCPDRFKKPTVPCKDCHGLFRGPSCLDHHKLSGYCTKYLTCPTCCARFNREKEHNCFEAKCPSCGEMKD